MENNHAEPHTHSHIRFSQGWVGLLKLGAPRLTINPTSFANHDRKLRFLGVNIIHLLHAKDSYILTFKS
jgi:hypothetical protein